MLGNGANVRYKGTVSGARDVADENCTADLLCEYHVPVS
jgi:hypothetical protein